MAEATYLARLVLGWCRRSLPVDSHRRVDVALLSGRVLRMSWPLAPIAQRSASSHCSPGVAEDTTFLSVLMYRFLEDTGCQTNSAENGNFKLTLTNANTQEV